MRHGFFVVSRFEGIGLSLFYLTYFENETRETVILKHPVLCLICLILFQYVTRQYPKVVSLLSLSNFCQTEVLQSLEKVLKISYTVYIIQ